MEAALVEADAAFALQEVPVGAVLVRERELIARAHNQVISTRDPSAHAELLALRAGAASMETHRLDGCTLYVTLEPCLMCAGAVLNARITRLVYGAREPRMGAVCSVHASLEPPPGAPLQHRVMVREGVHRAACVERLRRFFEHCRTQQPS